jgi:hypothetical protein
LVLFYFDSDPKRSSQHAAMAHGNQTSTVWGDTSQEDDEPVTRGDLVRFAQQKQRLVRTTERHNTLGTSTLYDPIRSLLELQWGDFMSFCASISGGRACTTAETCGDITLLEAYWAHRTSCDALRHSGYLTEELLLLCVAGMTRILEERIGRAAALYRCKVEDIVNLALREPWTSKLENIGDRVKEHIGYCEKIELDDRISSLEKGAALDMLLALRREKAEVIHALQTEQLELLPSLEPYRSDVALAYRRLATHRSCRGQGRGVMQHLPSFECTSHSDASNDSWRPVHSALLFSGWELQTRALHDAFREHAQGNRLSGASNPPPRPPVEDEVAVVQGVLREAMQSTNVTRNDFFRLTSVQLKW